MLFRTSVGWRSCVIAMPIGRRRRYGKRSVSRRCVALEQKVIDVVATDLQDSVTSARWSQGEDRAMASCNSRREAWRPRSSSADWRTKLLSILTNPNVAYLLMLAGVYGLLLEGYNPGSFVPGVVGAVCLLLALYAFQILSVNYAGLALIALGIALIVAEAFAPSFGALGVGGIVAFTIGSIMLFEGEVPGFHIARGLIGGMALAAAIVMLLTAGVFMRAAAYTCRHGRRATTPGARSRTRGFRQPPVVSIFTVRSGAP